MGYRYRLFIERWLHVQLNNKRHDDIDLECRWWGSGFHLEFDRVNDERDWRCAARNGRLRQCE